jgi:nucleoside 2-deoxyribosyltransferase
VKVVYIAGPFRARTAWRIRLNVHRAEIAAFMIASLGAMPLTPHKNTENFHGELTEEFWLRGCRELLRRCDAVYVSALAGSVGTAAEIALAEACGIPVFHELSQVQAWLSKEAAVA